MLTSSEGATPCSCRDLSGRHRRLLDLPIPLNRARSEDLQAIPGIGPVRAEAIVSLRQNRGPFVVLEELERIPGIGPATLARIRPFVFIAGPDPAAL